MKKGIIFIIVLFVLSACNQSTPSNEVVIEPINPAEYKLLKVAGVSNSLGFNLTIPEEQKPSKLNYSIDHYKNGQVIEENKPTLISPVSRDSENIEIYFSSLNFDQTNQNQEWVLAIRQIQKDGESLARTNNEMDLNGLEQQTLSSIQEPAILEENQEVPIGVILINSTVLDTPVYPTDITRIAKASKEAYVLKAKLTDLTTNP